MADFKEIQIGEDGQVYQVKDETARQSAGSGDGTVTAVKMNNGTPIEPDENGVVNLGTVITQHQDISGKVDKVTGKGLSTNDYTTEEKTKLAALPTNPVTSISVNGQTPQTPTQGNVDIVVPTMTLDDVPTAGSNNGVKSGGIKTAIDNATPTIDPTTKKWIVGGQLTNIVAEGQDGQDGNSGVASGDAVESVNDLNGGRTDTQSKVYVLGANMGKELADDINDLQTRVGTIEANGSGESMIAVFDGVDTLIIGNSANLAYIKVSHAAMTIRQTARNASNSKVLTITGRNLTNGITLALTDASGAFSLSANSISAANANTPNAITVTYAPTAVGAHTATITLTSGTLTKTVTLTATCVEQVVPQLSVNGGQAISVSALSGATGTVQVAVTGANLTANQNVTIAATGTGITVSPATLTADADGNVTGNVTVSFTAGNDDVSGTLTATQGNTTASVAINASVITPLSEGSYWYSADNTMKFTVLEGTQDVPLRVAVSKGTTNPSDALTIPGSVSDAGRTVYDSGGNTVPATGLTYVVYRIANNGFQNCRYLSSVVIENGVVEMGYGAFSISNTAGYIGSLTSVVAASSLTTFLGDNNGWGQYCSNQQLVSWRTPGATATKQYSFGGTKLTLVELNLGYNANNAINSMKSAKVDENDTWEKNTFINHSTTVPTGVAINSTIKQNTILYVPDEAVNTYKASSSWGDFYDVKGISELTN